MWICSLEVSEHTQVFLIAYLKHLSVKTFAVIERGLLVSARRTPYPTPVFVVWPTVDASWKWWGQYIMIKARIYNCYPRNIAGSPTPYIPPAYPRHSGTFLNFLGSIQWSTMSAHRTTNLTRCFDTHRNSQILIHTWVGWGNFTYVLYLRIQPYKL